VMEMVMVMMLWPRIPSCFLHKSLPPTCLKGPLDQTQEPCRRSFHERSAKPESRHHLREAALPLYRITNFSSIDASICDKLRRPSFSEASTNSFLCSPVTFHWSSYELKTDAIIDAKMKSPCSCWRHLFGL
jgi:hypothetical protein